jgi:hypothetical protein
MPPQSQAQSFRMRRRMLRGREGMGEVPPLESNSGFILVLLRALLLRGRRDKIYQLSKA